MQHLGTLLLSDDESEVLLVSQSGKTVIARQTILPDIDGPEVAIKMAAIEILRDNL